MKHSDTKRVATINDISGVGRCSLSVSIPILSAMGIQSCPIPTCIFTNQTGYSDYQIFKQENILPLFLENWKKINVTLDGIITGYFINDNQINDAYNFIKSYQKDNLFVLIDPVLGRDGKKFDFCTVEYMNSYIKLIECANIITPNVFELCLLTNSNYETLCLDEENLIDNVYQLSRKILDKGIQYVIVTHVLYKGNMVNILCDKSGYYIYKTFDSKMYFSGSDDIFSSIICGCAIRNIDIHQSLRIASSFLETAYRDTIADDMDEREGLYFECHLNMLTDFVNKEQSL